MCPDTNTIWINEDVPEHRRDVYKKRALHALVSAAPDGTTTPTLRLVEGERS